MPDSSVRYVLRAVFWQQRILPAERGEQRGKDAGERCGDVQWLAADRVRKGHRRTMQQQACAASVCSEGAVVRALAVSGIADDGVGDVFEVPTDLMPAPGFRGEFEQGVAAGGVAVVGQWQFYRGQSAPVRECGLGQILGTWVYPFRIIWLALQGVVDASLFLWPAAHDREVGLAN
ncbi:MAG: hypothetical protein QG592_320, partial [Pseudomonadota bacterium]|nr:hypothetical protein [Pseudomonadota bacterium]